MDKYVLGLMHSFDLSQWLLIDKGQFITPHGVKLKWSGIGGKISPYDVGDLTGVKEFPHVAMAREFAEEVGHAVIPKRWHCFFIKEYKATCKIYFFGCACSPDELAQATLAYRSTVDKHLEGQIQTHDYPSICFDPSGYTFDLRYIIPMMILEHHKGMFLQLDPEGVNSEFKRASRT